MINDNETLKNDTLLFLAHASSCDNLKIFFKNLSIINKNIHELLALNKTKRFFSDFNYTIVPTDFIADERILLALIILAFNNVKKNWTNYQENTVFAVFKFIKDKLVNIRSKNQSLEKIINNLPKEICQLKSVLSYLSNEIFAAGQEMKPLINKATDFRKTLTELIRSVKESFSDEKLKKEINSDACTKILSNILNTSANSVFHAQAIIDNFYSIHNRINNVRDTISDLNNINKDTDSFISDLYLTMYKTILPPVEAEIDEFLKSKKK